MYTQRISKLRTLAKRHRREELDDGEAFFPDFRRGFKPVKDADAEAFGAELIAGATSAQGMGEVARDELTDEDLGDLTIETAFDAATDFSELVGRKAS